ncbi:MAG: N-acetyltransferase [Proteobacteria bacterium]|nr:N-acetyltransferase [Pseudomonadota bacterium]
MIRKAKIQDIKAIHSLLQIYSSKGELLPRPFSKLYDHLRDFIVYADEKSGEIIGCCALQFCWEDLAEIRSLAVHPDYLRKNIGTLLAETVLTEAKTYDIKRVFSLTYKPAFFEKLGFVQVDKAELPLIKIWSDCMLCVKFPNCDEIAMIKEIV